MPVSIEEFNKQEGTSFSQENFNRGFMTVLSGLNDDKYKDAFSRLYFSALKEAVFSHVKSDRETDIVQCMDNFENMFKTSIDEYNGFVTRVSESLYSKNTVKFLEYGGMGKNRIKEEVDKFVSALPQTKKDEYGKKIVDSAAEDIPWGFRGNAEDKETKMFKASMRQINGIFDGCPTVKFFEGKPDEIEVPVCVDYYGEKPQTINFGKDKKTLSYSESKLSDEQKLTESVQVIKAAEEIKSEQPKNYSILHPIKNALSNKVIDQLKKAVISRGYSEKAFNEEYQKASPLTDTVKKYHDSISNYISETKVKSQVNQADLTKSLEKSTNMEAEKAAKLAAESKSKEVSKDLPVNKK